MCTPMREVFVLQRINMPRSGCQIAAWDSCEPERSRPPQWPQQTSWEAILLIPRHPRRFCFVCLLCPQRNAFSGCAAPSFSLSRIEPCAVGTMVGVRAWATMAVMGSRLHLP